MIKKFEDLLKPYIGAEKVVKDTKYTNLTAPGDNYGSLMLKVDIILLDNETKKEEILHLVAKILPQSEYYRKVFKVQITYTNEMAFYNIIIPTLNEFQKELQVKKRLNCFARCYGTRKNLLSNSDTIDDDAVLLLENLRMTGYSNGNRQVGFDFETAKLIIEDLANFHAVFLALKLKKPSVFKAVVLPYCFHLEAPNDEFVDYIRSLFTNVIKDYEPCEKLASKVKFWGEMPKCTPQEPFATMIHSDMWVNNTMQKYENGKLVQNIFIDFQAVIYGSPTADLFFFLWTSVQKNVLEKNLDYFLELYYQEFIKVLKNHKCDTSIFSYEKFQDEMKIESSYEFPHALTFSLFLGVNDAVKPGPIDEEEVAKRVDESAPTYKEKIRFMVEECHKRGWLY